MRPSCWVAFCGSSIKGVGHTNTRLSRCFLIQRDIVVQLGRLLVDLVLVGISLGRLNLESQHLKLQLQHLVLDLAVLQSCRIAASRRLNLVVESAGASLSILGCDSRVLDDL